MSIHKVYHVVDISSPAFDPENLQINDVINISSNLDRSLLAILMTGLYENFYLDGPYMRAWIIIGKKDKPQSTPPERIGTC